MNLSFEELLVAIRTLLDEEGRVAYRVIKRRFELTDDDLEDIKSDLIDAKRIAVDENDRVLVAAAGATQTTGSRETTRVRQLGKTTEKADRRLITVMFCDIVGSTELSERFDAEELREVVRDYQIICAGVIDRYEGHIAQYLGDGLLVYFGYPNALEDEAERCVQAALETLAALNAATALSARLGASLRVRIGIHSGRVVIGEMGSADRHERLALGDTPNIAARVQAAARPNEILITAATQRLVDGLFECELHGPHTLKGVREPIELYTVKGESAPLNRFEVAVMSGNLSRFVGREQELAVLSRLWAQACAGKGQVVLLSGEPGMGKSRLSQEYKNHLGADARQIVLRCSPNHSTSTYYPMVQLFRRVFALDSGDTDAAQITKLESGFAGSAWCKENTIPAFASMLGIEHPGVERIKALAQEARQKLLAESVIDWFLDVATREPAFVVFDDVHWMDPATHELLNSYLEHIGNSRTLVSLIYRSDFRPPWLQRGYFSQMTIGRLPDDDAETMVAEIAHAATGSDALIKTIVEKADGIPLFIEELTKAVVDAGWFDPNEHGEQHADLRGLSIPATLQDLLEARLDHCGPGKTIAQWAAVIGREFSQALLDHLITDHTMLSEGLDELLAAELIYRSGTRAEPSYIFKHALIRDTAYESLLVRQRREYHAKVAAVLLEHFADTVEDEPELIAEHYASADIHDRAAEQLYRAGRSAIESAANTIAHAHLSAALAHASKLPDLVARARLEIRILLLLGPLVSASLGNSSIEVERVYKRTLKLCEQADDKASRFPAYFGLRAFYLARSDLKSAHEIGQALYRAASASGQAEYLLEANVALVGSSFFRGELEAVLRHADEGLSHYSPAIHRRHAWTYGIEPGALCLMRSAQSLWMGGYPDQARERMLEGLAAGEQSGHAVSVAFAHRNAATFATWLSEYGEAESSAEKLITVAEEYAIAFDQGWGLIQRGHARVCQDRSETGLADIALGLQMLSDAAPHETVRSQLMYPWFMTLVADAYGRSGEAEKGLAMLAEAVSVISSTGVRIHEPLVYLIRGDLFRRLNLGSEANKSIAKATELARERRVRSLELRALVAQVQLRSGSDGLGPARASLGALLETFTEGFLTHDLTTANALLKDGSVA